MTTYLSQDRLRHKENDTMTYEQSKMYQSKTFLLFGTLLLVAGQASAAAAAPTRQHHTVFPAIAWCATG